MPWSPEKPYVMHLYEYGKEKPLDLFFASRDELQKGLERYKMSEIYQRIWTGHGKTAKQGDWNTLGEWSKD